MERLFHNKLFRRDAKQKSKQVYKWRQLRFKIHETLSSNYPAPGRFWFRTIARVARKTGKGYGVYVHETPSFFVVSPWAMPAPGSDAALAREKDPSRHGWRGRYV